MTNLIQHIDIVLKSVTFVLLKPHKTLGRTIYVPTSIALTGSILYAVGLRHVEECYRFILDILWTEHISIEEVVTRVGLEKQHHFVKCRRMGLTGYVLRLPRETCAHVEKEWVPEGANRKTGRPTKTRCKTFTDDLEITCNEANEDTSDHTRGTPKHRRPMSRSEQEERSLSNESLRYNIWLRVIFCDV